VLGNLVNRTITLVNRFRPDALDASATPPDEAAALLTAIGRASDAIADSLDRFDFRAATDSLWSVVTEANRFVSATRPWELGKAERAGNHAATGRLDAVLVVLLHACRAITNHLQPFLPDAAARAKHALERRDPALGRTLFPKAELIR
jgi:methionyl-tRNA synthetase